MANGSRFQCLYIEWLRRDTLILSAVPQRIGQVSPDRFPLGSQLPPPRKLLAHKIELPDEFFFESSDWYCVLQISHQKRGLLFVQVVDGFRSAALASSHRF